MKTCLENCRPNDEIVWTGPSALNKQQMEDRIFVVNSFFESRPLIEAKHLTSIADDGRIVNFYQHDLKINKAGYVVTKIIKKSKCSPV